MATGLPRKKNPSQVAQAETPAPEKWRSLSRPSQRACAPVATISTSAVKTSPPSSQTRNGVCDRSTPLTRSKTSSAPQCAACCAICSMSQGPWIASAKPG